MSNTRWRMFALLLLLVTVNYVDRGSLSVALPAIKEDFHISAEVTGLLLSAFFWAYAAMQIPAGGSSTGSVRASSSPRPARGGARRPLFPAWHPTSGPWPSHAA